MRAAIMVLFLAGCTAAVDVGTYGAHDWMCVEGVMVDGSRHSTLAPECLQTGWIGAVISIAWALWLWSRINATHAAALRTERQVELLRGELKELRDKSASE